MNEPLYKRIINASKVTAIFLLLSVIHFSCKKTKDTMYSNVARESAVYNFSYVSAASAMRLGHYAFDIKTISKKGLPIILNNAPGTDVQITATIDTSLVKAYNELYQENLPALPANAFVLSNNGKFIVKAGKMQSDDSVTVELKNADGLQGNATYLIPVRLTAESASLKGSIMFLKINVTLTDVKAIMAEGSPFDGQYPYPVYGNLLADFTATQINDQPISGPESVTFTPSLNNSIPIDANVVAEMISNDSLAAAFNTTYSRESKPFPSGSVSLVQNTAKVNAGDMYASDNFKIDINSYEHLEANQSYVLALKIVPREMSASPDTTKEYIAFLNIRINKMETGNVDASGSALEGTASSRSGWKVTTSTGGDENYFQNYPSDVLDGNNNTLWMSQGYVPTDLILDMGKVNTMKGFKITPGYYDITMDFIQTEIYSSDDGVNWTKQGVYIGNPVDFNSDADHPDIKNIKFLQPVTARYFKFNVIKTSSYYYLTSMAEVNGVQ